MRQDGVGEQRPGDDPSSGASAPAPAPAAGAEGAWGAGVDRVAEALAAIQAGVEALAEAVSGSMLTVTDEQMIEGVRQCHSLRARLESGYLGLLRELDVRPSAVSGAAEGRVASTFLVHALHRSSSAATMDVRIARALDPAREAGAVQDGGGMPAVAAAFAAGLISREHVEVAVKGRDCVPLGLLRKIYAVPEEDSATEGEDRVVDMSGAELVDELLAHQSSVMAPESLKQVVKHLLEVLDPTRADRYDTDAHLRRSLTMGTDDTGMVWGRFQLTGSAGARLRAAIESLSKPAPAGPGVDQEGQETLIRDERTPGQRRADALAALASHALTGVGLPTDSVGVDPDPASPDPGQARAEEAAPDQLPVGSPFRADGSAGPSTGSSCRYGVADGAQVLVITTLEQLIAARRLSDLPRGQGDPAAPGLADCAQTGPISASTLAALACDAVLTAAVLAPSGAVMHLGRSTRTATWHQRKALAARDQGCVIPACDAPPARCQAHHVQYWSQGGPTDITNLALVCGRHHDDVHAGVWRLVMIDGVPWAIPPAWVDSARRPLQNPVHRAARTARRLAQQLQLDLPLSQAAGLRAPPTGGGRRPSSPRESQGPPAAA